MMMRQNCLRRHWMWPLTVWWSSARARHHPSPGRRRNMLLKARPAATTSTCTVRSSSEELLFAPASSISRGFLFTWHGLGRFWRDPVVQVKIEYQVRELAGQRLQASAIGGDLGHVRFVVEQAGKRHEG